MHCCIISEIESLKSKITASLFDLTRNTCITEISAALKLDTFSQEHEMRQISIFYTINGKKRVYTEKMTDVII